MPLLFTEAPTAEALPMASPTSEAGVEHRPAHSSVAASAGAADAASPAAADAASPAAAHAVSPAAAHAVSPECAVCHSVDVLHDEVDDGGPLLLAECRRCEHRWTLRPLRTARRRRRAPARRGRRQPGEAAAAARGGVASAA